jgi:choline dehydrogenase
VLPGSDLQVLLVDVPYSPDPSGLPEHGFAVLTTYLRPASRGMVRLASPEPDVAPLIDPRYLGAQQDVDAMLSGMALIADMADTPRSARSVTPGTGPSVDGRGHFGRRPPFPPPPLDVRSASS